MDIADRLAELGIPLAGKPLTPRLTHRCRCPQPACAGKRGEALALTVDADGGGAVFVCHRCGWHGSVRGGAVRHGRPAARRRCPAEAERDDDRTAFVRRLIGEAGAAPGTPVEAYLAGRGLDASRTRALLYHPGLWHTGSRRSWPAMLAPIVDAGGAVVGLHRTWLAPDGRGKAPVADPRKSLSLWPGATRGAAIRLAPADERLIIGEGIETTLAAMQMLARPGWAAISAGNLRHLVVPQGIRQVMIVADHDDNGVGLSEAKAAASAISRRGLAVDVVVPRHPGDANDVWRRRAAHHPTQH